MIFLNSPITHRMQELIIFHEIMMFTVINIVIFITILMYIINKNFNINKLLKNCQTTENYINLIKYREALIRSEISHSVTLELIWTILPIIILFLDCYASFFLIYSEITSVDYTKVFTFIAVI